MSYQQYGLIEAADYNNFVGTSSTPSTGQKVNTILGVGNGKHGLGQTALPNIQANAVVSSTVWTTLINTMTQLSSQESAASMQIVEAPASGRTVKYIAALNTNLASIYAAKGNAALQGTTAATTTTNSTQWNKTITFTHTVTFPSEDSARYFFNAGGQLAINFATPSGTGINGLFTALATASGTVVISSPTTETLSIAGNSYRGVTKVGGSGTPTTISPSSGYYGLPVSDVVIFKQLASFGKSDYFSSYIQVSARTNGSQGTNGDNGSTITITTLWEQIPNGLYVSAGTNTTITIKYPSTSYLTNTWGTVSVVGTVSGS
jgi:hypothetical protein